MDTSELHTNFTVLRCPLFRDFVALRLQENYIFNFRCDGLILLETYTTLKGDELIGRLPQFLNVVKEVTGDPSFSMFNLSLKSDWTASKLKVANNCVDGAYRTIVST